MDWKHLKSGTDIRGVALDGPNGEQVDLTDEVVEQIGAAFAVWLCEKTEKQPDELTVSVGRDSRLSGPRMRDAIVNALCDTGIKVIDCGLASTPAMFMTTVDLDCDGAVQITASHHPYYRNGLKFFLPSGGLEGAQITEILAIAAEGKRLPRQNGKLKTEKYMNTYAARLRKMICEEVNAADYEYPLAGTHIVVDAGNGVGGFYATKVLEPLGADVTGSQFLDPDGSFPNHIPNPEDKDAMASVSAATLRAAADLGVIFDTDVDRAGCVDNHGLEINRNRLIALAAYIALEKYPGGTVVTDSVTSDGLKTFIETTLGGRHCRFKRGYKNVIGEAVRLNNAGIVSPLAIETSGHAALMDNYFLDDGAYLITKIIILMAKLRERGRNLTDVIASLPEPAETKELRFDITREDFAAYGNDILTDLEKYANARGWAVADDSREGVRISFGEDEGDGWLLLRLSVHDPVMPLNIESNRVGGCDEIFAHLSGFLADKTGLRLPQ
ncbi:MAG: phosphomannomutase/phosphoglucomutase [Clostridia bacterium]|nr:phosphomannomutase/phosphoglucomutase [Clostridia bacterium]